MPQDEVVVVDADEHKQTNQVVVVVENFNNILLLLRCADMFLYPSVCNCSMIGMRGHGSCLENKELG